LITFPEVCLDGVQAKEIIVVDQVIPVERQKKKMRVWKRGGENARRVRE
jgi:hypothetical protein